MILIHIAYPQAMYPSIQAKIWGNMGKVTELVDTVLDSFIKVCGFFNFAVTPKIIDKYSDAFKCDCLGIFSIGWSIDYLKKLINNS